MPDFVRDGGGSFARLSVWIILGVLALAFGLSFGLPSESLTFGPQPLASVYGHAVQKDDYAYQLNITASTIRLPEDERYRELMGVKEEILESIVERIVFAELADELGLSLETRDAEELTFKGHLVLMGDTFDWLRDTPFNYDTVFQSFIRNLAISEQKYLETQRQELLARTMRDLVGAGVAVSEAEMRAVYDERENQISLRYVRLQASHYAELIDPTTEEIDAWIKRNQAELDERYEVQAGRFLKLPPQVHLRFIRVEKPSALAEDADDDAKKAHAELSTAAKKKVEDAIERLGAGDPFPVVARTLSDDPNTARGGGDYGWVSVDGTGSGLETIVDQTAAKLEDGQTSEVVEGDEAYYIVKVEGHREGDVPKEDAMREIAFESVRKEAGRVQARQAAQEALLRLKEGEKFEEVFAGGEPKPQGIESLPMQDWGELDAPAAVPEGPRVATTGLFAKGKPVPGLGPNADLANAAWEAEDGLPVIDRVFDIDDGFVIAAVDEKLQATDDGFAAARSELFRELAQAKSGKLAAVLAHRRCLEAKGRGVIKPNASEVKALMTYSTKESFDEDGNRITKPYSMCDRVGNRGGMMRVPAAFAGGR